MHWIHHTRDHEIDQKLAARDAIFKRLKEEMASDPPGIRVLCPTRWTVRAEALKSILDNYNVLLELCTGVAGVKVMPGPV